MFLLPSIVIGLVVALAAGGDVRRLAAIPFRRAWLVLVALGVQLVLFSRLGPGIPDAAREAAHIGTYGLLLGFGVANRHIRAIAPIVLGTALNATVVAVNGGTMPLSPRVAAAAGLDASQHTNVSEQAAHLRWLGDVFALPSGFPLANAFSVGDVLIAIGAIWLVATAATVGVDARVLLVRRFVAPLKNPGVGRLVAGKLVSQVGDWLTIVAVVGWIYGRGASTTAVAVLLLVRMAPPILGGGVAAVVVDRLAVARLLPAVEIARGLVVAVALLGTVVDSLPVVFAALAVSGVLAALAGAATPAALPSLVPTSELLAANAALGMTKSLAMLAGAGGGAIALAQLGVSASLALDLATFAVAALLLRKLRIRDRSHQSRADSVRPRFERIRYLLAHRQAALLILCFSVATFATGLTNASFPRYFDSLGGSASSYGLAIAALAVGLVLGELFVASTDAGGRRWIGLGLLAMAGLFAMLAATEQTAMALLVIAAIGFVDGTTDVFFDTALQQMTEPSRRGAVFGASMATMSTTMMAGVALAPLLAGAFAPSAIFWVVAGALGVAGGIGLLASASRHSTAILSARRSA